MNHFSFTPSMNQLQRPFRLLLALTLGLGLSLSLWLALTAAPQSLQANTLCVKPGGGDGCEMTIQDALDAAQAGDTILVAAGTYIENVHISQTVTLQGGWSLDFSIRDLSAFSVTILPTDNTRSVVAIQGQSGDPTAVIPTLDGFVITGGRADLGSNHGGGLRIIDSDALVISNTIKNNVAFYLGGGVWVQRGAPTLQGNHIMDNRSVGLGQEAYGGGVQLENSPAALLDNLIAGNVVSGTAAYGGGVQIAGTGAGQAMIMRNQVISNVTLAVQQDSGFGGGIALSSGGVQLGDGGFISNTAGIGGAIFIGGSFEDCCNLTGHNNAYRQNSADQGGAVFIGGMAQNCCMIRESHTLFRHNNANAGGALYVDTQFAALDGGMIISNTAAIDGGGVFIAAGGRISLTNSTLIENRAGQDGGAIRSAGLISATGSFVSNNTAVMDGGAAFIATGGSISLTNSALIDNRAGQDGGAIRSAGFISVTNSTVSGNTASGMGGGIANFNSAYLLNATVSENSSPDGAGLMNANMVVVMNSLIAQNTGDNCSGGLFSLGHNLEDGVTCTMGHGTDQNNTPANMGSLADNGGGTSTHALMAGSPAIDAGDNAACSAVDQRGAPRPVDGDGNGSAICDIGAYEYGAQLPWVYLPFVARP